MADVQRQLQVLADEMNTLKNELVGIKAAHANMHQASIDAGQASNARFVEVGNRLSGIESKIGDLGFDATGFSGKHGVKPLMKPEQVKVGTFQGGVTDSRAKFLEWNEQVKDRVRLYDVELVKHMTEVEMRTTPVTAADSESIGVPKRASDELHGFL